MNITAQPVVVSLAPVFLLIALGVLAGRQHWIRESSVRDLSNLVFLLLTPALMFRTMASVRFDTLDWLPVLAYFLATLVLLGVCVLWRGFNCRSVVLGLASTFSNTVMIGIALIELAYGKEAQVTLLTLVSLHALILLTTGSVMLEIAAAREARAGDERAPHVLATAWSAFKGALIHPVPLPILCGLLFAQTGWTLPVVLDRPLQMLGSAFGPIALVLVGVTLARTPMGGHLREALSVALTKNLVMPVLVGLSAWGLGVSGLALTVLVVTAALPAGANVFLFAQRYEVAEDATVASMGLSTVLAIVTLSLTMALMAWIN